jgi:tight adherence protein B
MARRLRIVFTLAFAAVLLAPAVAAADQLGLESVNTSSWPRVTVSVTLPSSAGAVVPNAARVWENGIEVPGAQIGSASADRQKVDVVLVVDVSGSMKGAPLANAQAAAERFVSLMGPNDRVAVVTFGSVARVVRGFSSDPSAVGGALSGLSTGGNTALYDGVSKAVDMFGGEAQGRRAIVLLSDGKDTASATDLDTAIDAARKADTPVYVVGMNSSDYNPRVLQTIATATGGRLTSAKQPSSWAEIFGSIATEINAPIEVTYQSNKPNTADLEVRVVLDGAKVPLTRTVWVPNPAFVDSTARTSVSVAVPTDLQMAGLTAVRLAIAVLAGIAVGLLVFAVLSAFVRARRPMDELWLYDQVQQQRDLGESTGGTGDASRRRVLGLVDAVAGIRGFTGLASRELERAGLPLRPNEYILLHFVGVVLLASLAHLVSGNLAFTLLVLVAATAIPLVVLDRLGDRRRAAFEEQLPDILLLIAGSLRAGWGLEQSIDLVVQEAAEPVVTEFRRAQTEVRFGLSLDQALIRVGDRLDSDDFRWAARAVAIQREVGGNLSEVLETLAATIRERGQLQREISTLTADGRFSAMVLSILPFLMAGVLFVISPDYVMAMVTSPLGQIMLATGFVLLVVGVVWLQRVVRIDV